MARRKKLDPQQAAVEELVAGVETPEQMEAVFRQLKQRMVEQVLQAELTAHLGYPPGEGQLQSDGRVRRWVLIEPEGRYLRVVLLADRETVHNAFFDRRFVP